MKYLTMRLLVILTILFCSKYINAQWYDVSSNLPSGWYTWAIDAIDSLTAIVPINNDSIYITTNGGLIWNPIPHPMIGTADISMVTTEKIWLCTCGYGKIYATSDGGNSWELQFDDTSSTTCMNYIEMFDSLNGVAMGDAPEGYNKPALFLRTTDGGNNWISMNQNNLIGLWSGDLWRRVDFVDINTGYFYASGESPQKLYKTTNGGADWDVVRDTVDHFQVLKFYDSNFGIVYPSLNGIYRTTDGGATWEDITIPSGHRAWGNDIEFAQSNPSKIWIVNQTTIYFSADYGNTWIEQSYNSDLVFRDLVFTDEEHGWLLGENNPLLSQRHYIFRTSNGGVGGVVSVENIIRNSIASEFVLEQNYPNPFNPSTKIKFTIPVTLSGVEGSLVTLKVCDILGNEIATLVNEELSAGEYEVEFSGNNLPSGVYFYQLRIEGPEINSGQAMFRTKKMLLLK